MSCPECEYEIDGLGNANRIRLTSMRADSISNARSFRAFSQRVEHLGLHVDSDHTAVASGHPGHGDREEAHATAEVHHGHARLHVSGEYCLRIVEQASQAIIDEVPSPPWTRMLEHLRYVLSLLRILASGALGFRLLSAYTSYGDCRPLPFMRETGRRNTPLENDQVYGGRSHKASHQRATGILPVRPGAGCHGHLARGRYRFLNRWDEVPEACDVWWAGGKMESCRNVGGSRGCSFSGWHDVPKSPLAKRKK